jgi:hypothetical protein
MVKVQGVLGLYHQGGQWAGFMFNGCLGYDINDGSVHGVCLMGVVPLTSRGAVYKFNVSLFS